MIRIFSGLFPIGSNGHTATETPIIPATEDIFYTGGREEKESFIPNVEYSLKEVKLSEPSGKQNTSLVCTDQQVEGKQILDTARLDSKDRLTDEISIINNGIGAKRIETVLAEISNSWTSRDGSSNKALDNLKATYGLGFVDVHDPACFSQSSGNRYLFLKLPLKNSSGSLVPIARTRNWRGEPVYLNPALAFGEHGGREFILLKYRGAYLAIDHHGGVRIATNVKEPEVVISHRHGASRSAWFFGG